MEIEGQVVIVGILGHGDEDVENATYSYSSLRENAHRHGRPDEVVSKVGRLWWKTHSSFLKACNAPKAIVKTPKTVTLP